jgi:hypothetical protein
MYYPLSPSFSVDLDFLREWFLWQLGGGGGGGGGGVGVWQLKALLIYTVQHTTRVKQVAYVTVL